MMKKIGSFEEYTQEYAASVADPEAFWARQAESFVWKKKWDKVLEWDFQTRCAMVRGRKTEHHRELPRPSFATHGEQTAILWEPNDPNEAAQHITYRELHDRVCRMANVLKRNGAKKGDRICLYMPMVPELAIAVLACARIGAIHSVVFAGFSARSLSDRIQDATCNIIVTADGGYRGNKTVPLKSIVDEALLSCPSITRSIILKRTNESVIHAP
jgi:acetyl-CoA synthetase